MGLIKQRGVVKINNGVWHADIYNVTPGKEMLFSNGVQLARVSFGNLNKLLSELNDLIYFKGKGITRDRYEDIRQDAKRLLKAQYKNYDHIIIGLWKESPGAPDPLECECLMGIDDHGSIWVVENVF